MKQCTQYEKKAGNTAISRTIPPTAGILVAAGGTGPLVRLCQAGPNYPMLRIRSRHREAVPCRCPICAVGRTTAPRDSRLPIPHRSGIWSPGAALRKQAVIVAMTGGAVAWHDALFRPDVFTKVGGHERSTTSADAPAARNPAANGTPFLLAVFQGPGVAEDGSSAISRKTMQNRMADAGFRSGGHHMFRRARAFSPELIESPLPKWLTRPPSLFQPSTRTTPASRREEMVSQHRPQCGTHRAMAGAKSTASRSSRIERRHYRAARAKW